MKVEMEDMFDDLFARFKAKGFLPEEIPDLVKDAIAIAKETEDTSKNAIEQELEELGWGIGVLDTYTYHLINLLKTGGDIFIIER
jgi:hypothetical protein